MNKSRIPQAGLTEMNSAKTNSRSGLKAPGFATAGIKPSAIASALKCFISYLCWLSDSSQKRPRRPMATINRLLPPPEYRTAPHVLTPETTHFPHRFLPVRPSLEQRRPLHSLRPSDRALEQRLQDLRHPWVNEDLAHPPSHDHTRHSILMRRNRRAVC
jgi:hypothetical protein